MDLSGKRILVTGGGSGLGRVLAEDFAAAGGDVHICGRRPEPLQAVTDATPGITAHILDVTDETATDAMFESIGHADIVIANAGIAESAPLHRTSTEMWHRIMAVNLTGCFLTFRGRPAAASQCQMQLGTADCHLFHHRTVRPPLCQRLQCFQTRGQRAGKIDSGRTCQQRYHRKCTVSGISGHRDDRPQHRQYHCQDRQVA